MWFSSKSKGTSIALIDINSSSVAAAFVRIEDGRVPILCYTVRVPLEIAPGATIDVLTVGVVRALEIVADHLVREGAPALRAIVGEGSVDHVVVSFGSPWQEAKVETKIVQKAEPFTFTRSFAADMLGPSVEESGRSLSRSVIATLLNGYLTREPYGKVAKHAEIIVLSTAFNEQAVGSVEEILRKCFHTRDISYSSFLESSYRALQDLYPHESDFLTITVTNEATEVASVKRGHLMDSGAISCGSNVFGHEQECATSLSTLLREFATRHALPRTVFLIAENEVAETLKKALDDASLHALWLSDVPVTSISILPSHFTNMVKTKGIAEGDTRLAILALSAGHTV